MQSDNYHVNNALQFTNNADFKNFLADVALANDVPKLFGSHHNYCKFDIHSSNLKKVFIEELIETGCIDDKNLSKIGYNLNLLHEIVPQADQEFSPDGKNNLMLKLFNFSKTRNEYYNFVRNIIKPIIGGEFYYQLQPTIRVNFPFPKNYSQIVNYHTDLMLGHLPYIMNFWWPLTDVFGNNSMAMAGYDFSKAFLEQYNWDFRKLASDIEFKPEIYEMVHNECFDLKLQYGEIFVFDPLCIHATQYNKTNATRVSFDCRFVLKNRMHSVHRDYVGVGTLKMPMKPGHYFAENPIV